jgi:molecular chaperone HscB
MSPLPVRKLNMNYFELYDIPFALTADSAIVKKKFYELSRKYHPDFFTNDSETEQAEALEKSAAVNKAFKIFSDADETVKYFLQLKGLLQEEEKYQLSPDFLMEMMEINESLMDAKMENNTDQIASVQTQIFNLQSTIYEPVKEIVEHYKADTTTEKELLQVKEYYYRKKYLKRILEGME